MHIMCHVGQQLYYNKVDIGMECDFRIIYIYFVINFGPYNLRVPFNMPCTGDSTSAGNMIV